MSRSIVFWLLAVVGLGSAGTIVVMRSASGPSIETLDSKRGPTPAAHETVGFCPWRNADADRERFFPNSTAVQDETLVLSRDRDQIKRRLGYAPSGSDNILLVHTILRDHTRLGAIITRAVRGESGLIELVLAVDEKGTVVGARLQRLREPDEVAHTLQSAAWLGAFHGKSAASEWQLDKDFPAVPSAARISANALLDGARTTLILLEVGRSRRS